MGKLPGMALFGGNSLTKPGGILILVRECRSGNKGVILNGLKVGFLKHSIKLVIIGVFICSKHSNLRIGSHIKFNYFIKSLNELYFIPTWYILDVAALNAVLGDSNEIEEIIRKREGSTVREVMTCFFSQ